MFFTFGFGGGSETPGSNVLLGGKGAGLMWMASIGAPVPPGFIIPTSVWEEYDKAPKGTMKKIAKELPHYLAMLEAHFGYLPLLSVRSGARVSCPGMMDTILNVGLAQDTWSDGQNAWKARLGTECYTDSLHRLVSMYGSVVRGINKDLLDVDLASALQVYETHTGEAFPDAFHQLLGAIEAVFLSWDNNRADVYRKLNDIPREWGTAVTVQAMVFGNMDDASGTGVLFSRNPDTGECKVTGEWLPRAQGEDIVAGTRTPLSLDALQVWNKPIHDELVAWALRLEINRTDVQDIEFTIQSGKLWLLQTRSAKRSPKAAIKIAVDMVKSETIDALTAVRRVTPRQFDQAQAAHLDPKWSKPAAFTGIGACSGVVTGKPVFTKEAAIKCKEPCILVTAETTPDDIAGMYAAVGVVTMVGGLTCHAAVVARFMNRACIVGVGQSIEAFKEIDVLSLDGATGRIWTEQVPIIAQKANGLIEEFSWLVTDALGVVPVITSVPHGKLKQALLYLGDKMLHPKKAAELVAEVLEHVDLLYLDLEPSQNSPESEFLALCEAHHLEQRTIDAVALELTPAQCERVTTLGYIKAKQFKMLGVESDLRSLVMADKELLFSAALDSDDPAIAKVLAWKKASDGLSMVSIGKRIDGIKSVLSMEQAWQLIAEGEV